MAALPAAPPQSEHHGMIANIPKIDIAEKFALFSEHWRPKAIAALNGQELKLVKLQGVFPWHVHEHEDEMFLVWRGKFRVEFRDRVVELDPGQLIVVPRGHEHRTAADEEAEVLIFEPAATRNTGNVEDVHFTAPLHAGI
jgi:mannose-6-phosphate isomerase-like protein (cupin superfamily)